MKDCYNREQIQDFIDFYKNRPDDDYMYPEVKDIETIDEFIERHIDPQTIPYKDYIKILSAYRDALIDIGDFYSLNIINKLIGDKKLYRKIRMVHDGSFLNNRIVFIEWFDPFMRVEDGCNSSNWHSRNRKKINRIYGNYDIIFLHLLPIDDYRTKESILNRIREGRNNHCFCEYDEYWEIYE